MEIAGLPLHPLVVHAAVTVIPLSAAVSIVFAVLPRWRWLFRWPTAVLALGAPVLAWVARQSGEALLDARPELAKFVTDHQDRGELLALVSLPYALVVVVAAWSLASVSALASGRGAQESRLPALEKVLPALVVLSSVVLLVVAVLAGDSGARAVWG